MRTGGIILLSFIFIFGCSFSVKAQESGSESSSEVRGSPFWKPTFSYKKGKRYLQDGRLLGTGDLIIDEAPSYFFVFLGELSLIMTNARKAKQSEDVSLLFVVKKKEIRSMRYICKSRFRILSFLNRLVQRRPIEGSGRDVPLKGMRNYLEKGLRKKLPKEVYFEQLDLVLGKYILAQTRYIGVKRNIFKQDVKTCINYTKEEERLNKELEKAEKQRNVDQKATSQELRQKYRNLRRAF